MRNDQVIPAGAGEIMQYIVHPFNDNTIRFVLHYPCLLNADTLQQAAYAVASSVDILHSSFIAGDKNGHWQVNSIEQGDCFTHIITDAAPVEQAMREALKPIGACSRVQMRCVLVEGKQECAVVVLISHLCADGSDGKYLLCKLCEAYNMLRSTGDCAALKLKNGSRSVKQVYAQLNRRERLRLLKDPRAEIKSVFPFPDTAAGEPVVLCQCIPAEKMVSIHHTLKQKGATINDLLLTACYYAYAEVTAMKDGEPMSIMSMMDLRKHCEGGTSKGLCNLTGPLVTVLPEGLKPSFDETLQEIACQTCRNKEDPLAGLYGMPLLHSAADRLPLKLLLAVSSRVYGSMSLGLTNIGNIDSSSLQMETILPTAGWFGGPVKRKPGVQISAASFNNTCSLCIWCYATAADKVVLNQLMESVVKHFCNVCK